MPLINLTCRNLNKYYKYILYSSIFLFIKYISFGLNFLNILKGLFYLKGIFLSREELEKDANRYRQFYIRNIFSYSLISILSYIFYRYENKQKRASYIPSNKDNDKSNNENYNSKIELIYQEPDSIYYSNTFFLYFIFFIFLWVILDQFIDKLSSISINMDFWSFEFIFLMIFSKKILNIKIYKHQKVSMILTVFPLFLKVTIAIVLSYYFNNNTNNQNNNFRNKPINILYAMLTFAIYLPIIFLKSYINTKIKWYLDKKYISPHILLLNYGIIGIIVYSIICTISTFKECEKTIEVKENIVDYICEVKDINKSTNETTKYLANFKLYFSIYKDENEKDKDFIKKILLEILTVVLGTLSFFFYEYNCLKVIKNLSPIHLMFSIPPLYFIIKIIMLIIIIKNSDDKLNGTIITIFILSSIADIFNFIINLIYFEILELNFCGLNFDLRYKIIERGLEDLYGNNEYNDAIKENDEDSYIKQKKNMNNVIDED